MVGMARQAGARATARRAALLDIEITPSMIDAGVAVLRDSGWLWAELSCDGVTVKKILGAALRAR